MKPMGNDFKLMNPNAPIRPDAPRSAPSMSRMQQLKADLNAAKGARQTAITQAKSLPDRAARAQAIADARSGMKDARAQAYETFRSSPKTMPNVVGTPIAPDKVSPLKPPPTTLTPAMDKPIAPDKTAPLMPPPAASAPPGMKKGGKTTVMKTASKGRKCDW
jgi:hypothetical protein